MTGALDILIDSKGEWASIMHEENGVESASVSTHSKSGTAMGIGAPKSALTGSAHVGQSQALMQAGRFEEALFEARRGEAVDPHDADCHVLQGEALLALGDFEAAERSLHRACEAFPEHARLWRLLTTASWNVGSREVALAAIDRALALTANIDFAVHKGWMLFQTGDLALAEDVLRDAIRRCPEAGSANKILTHVYKRWERWSDGAEVAARACAQEPDDFDLRESWAACLLRANCPSEAIAVAEDGLRQFVDPAMGFQLLTIVAEAHQQLGNVDGAIESFVKAIALQPNDETALEKLCNLMLTEGRSDQARPYRARLLAKQAKQLPARFADGLRMLWDDAHDHPLESPELDWAWELADKSAWNKIEWRIAATWGKEASLFLRRWWDSLPQAVSEIDKLLEEVDLSEVFAVAGGGRSCLLVGAHVGPMGAAVGTLRAKLPFKTFGTADRDQLDSKSLIPAVSNYFATTRALVNEVKRGTVIGLLADEPLARETISVAFLGREIHLPVIVPRLIQAYALPSFWCCPLWRNDRIVLEVERLPDPQEAEPRIAWSQRWIGAYLNKIEKVMRGHPHNLGLYSGIWGNVNQTVSLKIQKL